MHDHNDELTALNRSAESARKHGRPSTATRKQTEADRLDHHVREFHMRWIDVQNHGHAPGGGIDSSV